MRYRNRVFFILGAAMAKQRPDVLAAAKNALRAGAAGTMKEAMERERRLSSELSAKRKR